MRIEGGDGSSFELSLLGWQHPRGAGNEIDANRLRVRIAFESEAGSFMEVVPGLVAWEAERLAEWLEALAGHRAAEREQCFLEPDLRFRIAPASGLARVLRVAFDLRARRPGQEGAVGEFAFALDDEALAGAARALRAQVRRFPTREAT